MEIVITKSEQLGAFLMKIQFFHSSGLQCHDQLVWPDKSPISLLPGSNYKIDLIIERNVSKTGPVSKFSRLELRRKEPLLVGLLKILVFN